MQTPLNLTFVLSRDRDAWATIRGFVLQVDRTIAAWLDLGAADFLELERGEDIDHIASAVRTSLGAPERMLEQVKQQQARLTLRTEQAREALANFFLHRQANPGHTLRFRFATTAAVGRERRSTLPGRLPAILAWEKVRRGSEPVDDELALLEGLRIMVGQLSRPESVPTSQWADFQELVRTADANTWRDFVVAFEWSTGVPDSRSLRPEIRARLQQEFGVGTAAEADAIYQHLFASVFEQLATKGRPPLSRAGLLDELHRAPGAAERARIAELSALHDALARHVEDLEQRLEGLGGVLAATAAQVEVLAAGAGITAVIDPRAVAAPPIAPPLPAARCSPRSATVLSLLAENGRARVVALSGATASGKTQLARLLAEQLGASAFWVRLAGLNAREAAGRLAHAVDTALAAADHACHGTPDWARRVAAISAIADVVVLDDTPAFREGDELGARLLPLFSACLAATRSVVVTSAAPLVVLRDVFGPETLLAQPSPPFTMQEVRDVLAAYGAPPSALADPMVRFLEGLTAGHPVLLHAAAQYLQARHWVLDLAFEGLLRRHYAAPTNRETIRTLLDEVADAESRELLYRLALAGAQFNDQKLTALAAISPAIRMPRERLGALMGPWLQPTEQGNYELSPLVRTLGPDDLAPPVRQACHRVLAELIVGRPQIGERELTDAIVHYVGAEAFDAAGLLLLRGLHAIHIRPADQRSLISGIWSDMPLPRSMSPVIRAMIRAYQAVLAQRAARPYSHYLAEADSTLEELSGLPAIAELGPALLVAISIGLEDAVGAAPFLRRALTKWPEVEESITAVIRSEGKIVPDMSALAWICSRGVRDQAGLMAWANAVAALPAPMRARVFGDPLGVHGASSLTDLLLLREYESPPDQRNWSGAAAVFERLEAAARDMDATPLIAAAREARISAVIEATGDVIAGVALAEPALREFAADPDAAFLIAKATGFGALDVGQRERAVEWLQRAEALPGNAHLLNRVNVSLRLAQVAGSSNPLAALAASERAVERARGGSFSFLPPELSADDKSRVGGTVLARALGELALARWALNDRSGATKAWLEAVDVLMMARDDADQLWRGLFVLMGHVSGYLTAMVTDGRPPAQTLNGTSYTAPRQGMLIAPRREAADLFRPELGALVGIHAMQLADSIDDPTTAVRWARASVERLQALGLWTAAVVPLHRLVEHAVLTDEYAAAIDWSTDAAAAHWVMRDGPSDPDTLFAVGISPRERIGPRTEAEWTDVDGLVIGQAVVPAFLRVATIAAVEPERAVDLAAKLRDACVAESAASPSSPIWPIAVALCEDTFLREPDARARYHQAKSLRSKGDAFRSLGVMAQLGASLPPGVPPGERLLLHLSVVEYLENQIGQGRALYEPVLVRFFVTSWQRAFADSRFYFRAPSLVATQLTELLALGPAQRVRRLIRVLASALGVTVSAGIRSWLDAA
jgi:hypothetical protein